MKLYKIGVALLLLALLTGCAKTEEPARETTTQPTKTTAATEPEQILAPVSGIPVETPYITFYCPEDWENSVHRDVVRQDSNYVLSFQLTTVETPVTLFSLSVGPEEAEGYYLGFLEDETGRIFVYSQVNEQTPEEWSAEDYAEICHQQERVNDLILQLHEDERFQPA